MEKINNISFLGEIYPMPLKSIKQYYWDYATKTPEIDNHFISWEPDNDDKTNPRLVAIFHIKNLKINQNATN